MNIISNVFVSTKGLMEGGDYWCLIRDNQRCSIVRYWECFHKSFKLGPGCDLDPTIYLEVKKVARHGIRRRWGQLGRICRCDQGVGCYHDDRVQCRVGGWSIGSGVLWGRR